MDKSGKMTLETAAAIIAALAALIATWLAYEGAKKPLMADVNCVEWKAPRSVVTELEGMDRTAIDPNRMTGVQANDARSMYTVTIENKATDVTENTRMAIPTALHWEVNWMDTKGAQTKVYAGNELIPLPGVQCGVKVHVKAWASCEPARPTKDEVLISQDHGGNARLRKITPVRPSMEGLDELIRISRPYAVPAAIVLISTVTILIKRYFPWGKQTARGAHKAK